MRKIAVHAALLLCCAAMPAYVADRVEAAQIADSVAFQGRLLDGADQPVTGNLDVTFSLWSDSTGGTQLWTQTQTVAIQKGLFSTCLGCNSASFFDVFTAGDLFLQTQLGGQPPMAPRTRIRNTPRAVTASSTQGEATNGLARTRGMVIAKPGSITPHAIIILDSDNDGDGHPEHVLADTADNTSARRIQAADLDGDGALDVVVLSEASTSGRLAIKTKGTGAKRLSVGGDCDDTDAMLYGDCDDDGDGLPENGFAAVAQSNGSLVRAQSEFAVGPRQTTSIESTGDSASMRCVSDLDRDGNPDVVVAASSRASGASLAIKTKGTGAQRYSTGGDCDDTDAEFHADCDVDGDGIADVAFVATANDTSASSLVSGGVEPTQSALIESFVHRIDDRSLLGLKTYQPGQPVYGNITFETGHAMTKDSRDCDDDGDGLSDSRLTMSTGHGGGGAGGSIILEADLDGDGDAETSMASNVQRKSGSIIYLDREGNEVLRSMVGVDSTKGIVTTDRDSDGDGVPEGEVSLKVLPTTSSVAIKTKGTGADANRISTVTTGTGFDSASSVTEVTDGATHSSQNMRTRIDNLESILKNIGILVTTVSGQSCTDTGASVDNAVDLNNDGTPDVVASSSATLSRSVLKSYFQSGDVPTQSQFAAVLDAAAGKHALQHTATDFWSSSTRSLCTSDSAVHEVVVSDPTAGTEMKVKEKANRTKCTSNLRVITPSSTSGRDDDCDGISAKTAWSSSSGGSTSSLTVEAATGVDPILHSSGAKLTVGGVWTNASDENLKENFQPVDGEEILDKVDALPITEWNYKTESDDVRHIGPTAQDFQQVFGVGSDGRSISTIDPSGIALAAIKELNRRVKEVDELKSEVKELKALVQKLAADKERQNRGN